MDSQKLLALNEQIQRADWAGVRRELSVWPPPDIAEMLLELSSPERILVFRALPRSTSAEVFAWLDGRDRDDLLQELSHEETRHLLANLQPDDRTMLLEELPGQVTQRLLNLLSPEDLQEARQLLGYPEDSVGRLMTPNYVAIRPNWTVEHALAHIRAKGRDSETINVVYIVDDTWKLIDALDLRRLILANPNETVQQIMDYTVTSIPAFDDREEAVRMMQRYSLSVLPVVDSDGILLGIVTVDDVLDVAQEEATEDFHKVGGVSPLHTSYRQASIYELFSKRIGWLLVLVLVNLASSGIIASFEGTLQATLTLAFFIPLLIDSGGNVGSQAATLMIRALATGDIDLEQWGKTLLRELGVGLLLGIVMGGAGWLLGIWRGGYEIGLIVGLSMLCLIVVANLVGFALPYLLTLFRLDPAVASSPLITTVSDALGLFIYFSIAKAFLGI
jgi:magnesium transporter